MKKVISVFVLCVLSIGGLAFAHDNATGIVKQRMDGMVVMKKAMATAGHALKSGEPINTESVMEALEQIITEGAVMGEYFPDTEESRQSASQATDLVWSDKKRFDRLSEELVIFSSDLAKAAKANDREEFELMFKKVGKACSACHEDFRKHSH